MPRLESPSPLRWRFIWTPPRCKPDEDATNAPVQTVHLHRPSRLVEGQWSVADIEQLFDLPFMDLLHRAATVHREHHDANRVQLSTCCPSRPAAARKTASTAPESSHYDTGLEADKLMALRDVIERSQSARTSGATRFAWAPPGVHPKTGTWSS